MFTGIIQVLAPVLAYRQDEQNLLLTIKKPASWRLKLGDSVAHNGACLTVSELQKDRFTVTLMPQTLQMTSFGKSVPSRVNLELPMRLSDFVGGHLVQGHVDTVGTVTSIDTKKGYHLTVKFPAGFGKLVVPKGSITLDGVSLTVAACTRNTATVALIPHTLTHTNLGSKRVGEQVNIEFDIIGKYATR